jgi:hypothetical protein
MGKLSPITEQDVLMQLLISVEQINKISAVGHV